MKNIIMLNFASLKHLDYHQKFLQERAQISDIFLVGGCVRDLLLGISKDPLDIDFTCEGKPEELDSQINTEGLSHFKTDKFGTITLILSDEKERSYQLTPLRTEGDYEDFRHPGESRYFEDANCFSRKGGCGANKGSDKNSDCFSGEILASLSSKNKISFCSLIAKSSAWFDFARISGHHYGDKSA